MDPNWEEWKVLIHARAGLSQSKTERQVKQYEKGKYRRIPKPPCGQVTSSTPWDRRDREQSEKSHNVVEWKQSITDLEHIDKDHSPDILCYHA